MKGSVFGTYENLRELAAKVLVVLLITASLSFCLPIGWFPVKSTVTQSDFDQIAKKAVEVVESALGFKPIFSITDGEQMKRVRTDLYTGLPTTIFQVHRDIIERMGEFNSQKKCLDCLAEYYTEEEVKEISETAGNPYQFGVTRLAALKNLVHRAQIVEGVNKLMDRHENSSGTAGLMRLPKQKLFDFQRLDRGIICSCMRQYNEAEDSLVVQCVSCSGWFDPACEDCTDSVDRISSNEFVFTCKRCQVPPDKRPVAPSCEDLYPPPPEGWINNTMFYVPVGRWINNIDVGHTLKNGRTACCNGTIEILPKSDFMEVAKEGKTRLTVKRMSGEDKMSFRETMILFSKEVEDRLTALGKTKTAEWVHLFRFWHNGMDAKMSGENDAAIWRNRIGLLLKLKFALLEYVGVSLFTTPGSEKKGIPIQFLESVLSSIDAVIAMTNSMDDLTLLNLRALASDVIENIFSLVQSLGGTPTVAMFGIIFDFLTIEFHKMTRKDLIFYYPVSRKASYKTSRLNVILTSIIKYVRKRRTEVSGIYRPSWIRIMNHQPTVRQYDQRRAKRSEPLDRGPTLRSVQQL